MILTSIVGIATIVRAFVSIVTDKRFTHARSSLTVVGLCACIAVEAFAGIEGRMRAAGFSVARILGARVSIVAGAFVHITVTVIVYSVARFGSRHERVARIEPQIRACSIAVTAAILVLFETRRSQGGLDRVLCTTADAGFRDALVALRTRDALDLLAVVALGTRRVKVTGTTAKAQPVRVLNARSGSVTKTSIGRFTRQTESREIRHADVLTIAASRCHQGTRPSLGTLRIAGF